MLIAYQALLQEEQSKQIYILYILNEKKTVFEATDVLFDSMYVGIWCFLAMFTTESIYAHNK